MYFWTTTSFFELEMFVDWLTELDKYPIEIYLNGVTYKFGNDTDKLFFIVGMEAYRIAMDEIGEHGDMGI